MAILFEGSVENNRDLLVELNDTESDLVRYLVLVAICGHCDTGELGFCI